MIIFINSYFLHLQCSHLSLASRKALAKGLYLIFRAVICPERKKQTKNKPLKSKYKKKCFWLKQETKDVPSTVRSKIDLCNSRPTAPLHDYPAAAAVFLTNMTIHQLYFYIKRKEILCVCFCMCAFVSTSSFW